ncbi:hypothetical protein HMPREF1062_01633 [Bacteroides cellulosilyticus CL02T12C19]|jgi:hypothetical protein|uniref:DUF4377 domain-containing protein n=1 Tax=Bacteroides cellulosilyticus CL02T12C19 TaxID=997874 RepID=I9QXN1_9BACE|nr:MULTISPECIES: hypothetical protein [Bacteroides]EIY34353.1 hypothetical protein HMPREF1062_01633 [Bacteroides cellulosilyticus CL02T12C19]MBD8982211.1 hypothetical protein [Bacteroides cellulosilyticus]MBS6237934.1 hypothetical protein [Bacteroides sp.]MCB6590592.1 hypothetical protein [Bacteroides cellulosilyticus]
MKIIKILALCLLSCLLWACPERSEAYITLVNKSDQNIVYQEYRDFGHTFSDALFQCSVGAVEIQKRTSVVIESLDYAGWKADFNYTPCIQFLIMDEQTYSRYMFEPCDTIRKYVPILHRYRVSLEDMEQANWTIVYPPEGEN